MKTDTTVEDAAGVLASPRRRQPRRATVGAGFGTYAVLALTVLFSAFPFYWMIVVASTDTSALTQIPPRIVPGPNLLENFGRVFALVPFAQALLNSVVVATSVTVSVLFFSSLAGFAFAKLRFRGRTWLFAIIVGTLAVPQQLGLIPLYMIVAELGWANELKAVIVPGLVTAFGVFWMRQFISGSVPNELLEAARVDGCSMFRTFWHVVVPAIRPAAAVLGLFTFLYTWNDFLWPLVVLGSPEKHTVQIALQQLNRAYIQDYALSMAGVVLATVPMLVVFFFLARQMIAGLMEGSVKG